MSKQYVCSLSGRIVGNEFATLGDGFFVDPDFLPICDCDGKCQIRKEESKDSSFQLTTTLAG